MLSEVQRVLVAACRARDPFAVLQASLASPDLTADERTWLASIDADGLRVTALIVTKLRFERIVNGDERIGQRFDADPEAFTRAFQRYCEEVAPSLIFPGEEAEAFERWERNPGGSS